MQQLKFILGSILVSPLMPLVFYQGNRIRREFPRLPEATGPHGKSGDSEQEEMTIVGLGESTMACVGIDTHENGFIGQFSKALANRLQTGVKWSVYAKSGYTAKVTRETLVPQIVESHVDLFIISLGGNDTFQLNSPKKWSEEVEKLIKVLRRQFPSTPILFTTMPPIHTFPAFTGSIRFVLGNLVRLHGEALEKVVNKFENVYYDPKKIELSEWLNKLPGNTKEDFYSDGVHPSKLTFEIWGQEMAELIVNDHYSKD